MARGKSKRSFLDRYLAGAHEAVWEELIALGSSVREERYFPDALAVARETMTRVGENWTEVCRRLHAAGFEFDGPSAPVVPARPGAVEYLDEFERRWGTLPLSGRAWYEKVHALVISFSRSPPPPPSGSDPRRRWHGHWMTVQSLEASVSACCHRWENFKIEWADLSEEERAAYLRNGVDPAGPMPFLPLVGFGMSASNCEEMGFRPPCGTADQVIFNDGGGGRYFVEYLRCRLLGPGATRFHGWVSKKGRGVPTRADEEWIKALPELTRGLRPF